MNASSFEELSGRIDGIARSVMLLSAVLEDAGLIDGQRLSEALRNTAASLRIDPVSSREASRNTLLRMARQMDDARLHR